MTNIELEVIINFARREQQLLNVASMLFQSHLTIAVEHGMSKCSLCAFYYGNDARVNVTVTKEVS